MIGKWMKVDTFEQFEASDFHEAEISAKSPEKQLWIFAGERSKDLEHDMILHHVTSLQVMLYSICSQPESQLQEKSRSNQPAKDSKSMQEQCSASLRLSARPHFQRFNLLCKQFPSATWLTQNGNKEHLATAFGRVGPADARSHKRMRAVGHHLAQKKIPL